MSADQETLTVVDGTCRSCPKVGTYTLTAKCVNCGWEGHAAFSRGHRKDTLTCPLCGCKRAVYGHDYVESAP